MTSERGRPTLVTVPAGAGHIGAAAFDKFATDTERPSHRVEIARPFALGKFPVTVGEYRAFRPGFSRADAEDLPVVNVSWPDAREYCAWLSAANGRAFRLPSEAEWEFACRAGSSLAFFGSDELTHADANFLHDEHGERVGPGARTPVGQFPPNAFGLHDLHGNVCEWVEDVWHPDYHGAPGDGAAWIEGGDPRLRVIRGGAWDYLPRLLRSSWRDALAREIRRDNVGFRIASSDLAT